MEKGISSLEKGKETLKMKAEKSVNLLNLLLKCSSDISVF